jgi:hypothetical protein
VLEVPIVVRGVHLDTSPIYHSVEFDGRDLMFKEDIASLESMISGYK